MLKAVRGTYHKQAWAWGPLIKNLSYNPSPLSSLSFFETPSSELPAPLKILLERQQRHAFHITEIAGVCVRAAQKM